MKIGELREKLSKLQKDEIIKIASEFYKLIPKAKKEDYDIDSIVNNPESKTKKASKNTVISFPELVLEVEQFIINVKDQNYLYPNKAVPKKERATWRFKVKKWHKELNNSKRKDADKKKQVETFTNLYEILCESCGYNYFSAYDTFESVKIEQVEFYRNVLSLFIETEGKSELPKFGIDLILNNYLNRYTLESNLMLILIEYLTIPDLKNKSIDYVKSQIIKNGFTTKNENNRSDFSMDSFKKKEKHNNLVELNFRLEMSLFNEESAIAFFKENHYERDEEVKLYILIRLLMDYREKDRIINEIKLAKEQGVKPRKSLRDLVMEIEKNNELPHYL